MYTLKVKLKQHTPLIHFQHDQYGATLRASEVKPKLDRYLFENKFCNDTEKCKQYLLKYDNDTQSDIIEGTHRAFNYSLQISASSDNSLSFLLKEQCKGYDNITGQPLFTTKMYPDAYNSIFMGNLGGKTKEHLLNFVFFDETTLIFKSKDNNVLDIIRGTIGDFIAETNFGNRISKGFGSYSVLSIDDQKYEGQMIAEWNLCFSLISNTGSLIADQNAMKDVFVIINNLWKYLKKNKYNSKLSKTDKRRTMLGFYEHMNSNVERVPSVLIFKPYIDKKEKNWDVTICVLTNKKVIEASKTDINKIYKLVDSMVDTFNDTFENYFKSKLYYTLTNVSFSVI